ncbi:MAG: hypothetical protein ACE5G0_07505 [Rhodothermales bacterium]
MLTRINNTGISLLGTVLLLLILTACQEQPAPQPEEPAEEVAIDAEAVQAAMQTHIEAKLEANEGTYDVQGIAATFDYLHDGVNEAEGHYVSCADFKAGEDVFDVDYYVTAEGEEMRVVKEVLHKKNGEEVNEVMWQAEE